MKVTDKDFYMDNMVVKILNIWARRVTREQPIQDACFVIEGREGSGKTTWSIECAYYLSQVTGRSFGNKNIFFSAKLLREFAQATNKQIIIYDEPALDMMNQEWYKKEQIHLGKLMQLCRKKQHIFIFNLTRFNKFYSLVERSNGLFHVYIKNGLELGRFVYIKEKKLEKLCYDFRTKHIRNYFKYSSYHGKFINLPDGIIDSKAYEREKDKAIMSIGGVEDTNKMDKSKMELIDLKRKIGKIKGIIHNRKELAEKLGVCERTLDRFGALNSLENDMSTPSDTDSDKRHI